MVKEILEDIKKSTDEIQKSVSDLLEMAKTIEREVLFFIELSREYYRKTTRRFGNGRR